MDCCDHILSEIDVKYFVVYFLANDYLLLPLKIYEQVSVSVYAVLQWNKLLFW